MSYEPYPPAAVPPPPPQTNTVGLVGLIVSLVGLTGCLIASPIGLIVSLFGLRHPSKGLAIGGVVVGALGTIVLVVVVVIYGAVIAACIGMGMALKPHTETQAALEESRTAIEDYRTINQQLPDEQTGNDLIGSIHDGWDRPLRYELSEDGENYVIRSAGPDGVFDTEDDVTSDDNFFEMDDYDFDPSMLEGDFGDMIEMPDGATAPDTDPSDGESLELERDFEP